MTEENTTYTETPVETENVPEAEAVAETNAVAETEAVAEADPVTETESEPVTETESESVAEAEQTTEAQSETPAAEDKVVVADEIAAEEKAEEEILKENKESVEKRLEDLQVAVANMTEQEAKSKSNQLRNTLEHDERALKAIFRELKTHRADGDELKTKRDELNAQVREISKTAQESRAKRDEVNQRIAVLKAERSKEMEQTKSKSDEINQLKTKRDEYNKISKGTYDILMKNYSENLRKFLEDDINLDHEKNLFERLTDLTERVKATKEANELHGKIQEIYNENKGMYTKSDELSAEIKQLSEESQKYHVEMIEVFRKVDELRKEADGYHKRLTERYALIKPTTAKIDPLKKNIAITRRELDIYLDRLKDFQNERDEKRVDKIHSNAQEKLKKNGRLSLEDLGALIEKGDIDFNKE
ncbi:coiled-coil protein [Methanimicrococcus blatticola]|uniref:Uncharacterized coiled-coil DUF342 family protein n=1 Tax=Methanimicrococcus blatticola TaxID=91560 RepID=A0A484F5J6_9EURY|nr:phosphoserine phosphatase [Methanimicrococcus blatticola]MBZ3935517.1 phosphoserine phosphatase [Methanimicrococcus blatticola]MCC2509160.1 phosphoserine phosphatase [Methanimicrococcus blatticola]TDQ69475.1 uncharacterized coiled-coil DUF342 family protein [Methanimicrococcus blatticola]